MSRGMKSFAPRWAKNFGLVVYSRQTKSGGETYALAHERDGFPTFLPSLANLPIGTIRQYLRDAQRGRRIMRKAYEKGFHLEGETPSIGHLPDDLAFQVSFGRYLRGEQGVSRPVFHLSKIGPRRW